MKILDADEDEAQQEPLNAVTSIDRISCAQLSCQDFAENYLNTNKPVIITNIVDDATWRVRSEDWLDGTKLYPNMDSLKELFGDEIAPVHEQSKAGFTIARPTSTEMTVAQYCDWWKDHHAESHLEEASEEILYLKDWKFLARFPDYSLYQWPMYFQNDWLNEYMKGAYRFVYLGPKGSCTRLHADVLQSYSWSTNVCGQKRWFMIPPQYTYLLYDCFGERLASHLHQDLEEGDTFYPGLKAARLHAIEVIQEATETIFVPSGWHHTVENMRPTLSVNHNWLNETNISWSWDKLSREIEALHESKQDKSSSNPNVTEHTEPDTGACCTRAIISDGTSQIEDDLYLMWILVSKKAEDTLLLLQQDSTTNVEEDEMRGVLRSVIPILQGIQHLIRTGRARGLKSRCQCNVNDLVQQVLDKI